MEAIYVQLQAWEGDGPRESEQKVGLHHHGEAPKGGTAVGDDAAVACTAPLSRVVGGKIEEYSIIQQVTKHLVFHESGGGARFQGRLCGGESGLEFLHLSWDNANGINGKRLICADNGGILYMLRHVQLLISNEPVKLQGLPP